MKHPILIDRTPPMLTGDTKKDAAAMNEYLNYLHEQMNYILTQIYEEMEET